MKLDRRRPHMSQIVRMAFMNYNDINYVHSMMAVITFSNTYATLPICILRVMRKRGLYLTYKLCR